MEWSVNEKSAMEVAAGAAYAGARVLVTMKQVGLNVASDPLMSLEYIGVKGGMVILVADDPGPISSQTEQDTRHYSYFSKLPCFDPSSVQEAYDMIQEAYEFSEKYGTPVFFRPTTRICHAYASIEVKDEDEYVHHSADGFQKDSSRWVIFPRLSFANHKKIEARNVELAGVFSEYSRNAIIPERGSFAGSGAVRKGIAAGGISLALTLDNLQEQADAPRIFKVATPHPFPEQLAVKFLQDLDEVLVLEELDPVIERELTYIAGKYHLHVVIKGKLTGDAARRMSPQGFLLRGQNSHEGKEDHLLRRYRLLYTGQRHASGYGRYLSLHGRRHQYRPGRLPHRTGYERFCFCR